MLLGSDSLAEALLDWCDPDTLPHPGGAERSWYLALRRPPPRDGPLVSAAELALIRGFDSVTVARLLPFVTTAGDGRIDLNSAAPEVLATLPGLGAEALSILARHHATGKPIESLESIASELSPMGQAALSTSWSELQQATVLAPTLFEAEFDGGVRGLRNIERRRALLVPVGIRLAVVRRFIE
jgi:general secretion pathway protein K